MTDKLAIHELRKTDLVIDEQIDTAVKAFFDDPSTDFFKVADGIMLNLAEAVRSHRPIAAALDDKSSADAFRRTTERTAILLSKPENG